MSITSALNDNSTSEFIIFENEEKRIDLKKNKHENVKNFIDNLSVKYKKNFDLKNFIISLKNYCSSTVILEDKKEQKFILHRFDSNKKFIQTIDITEQINPFREISDAKIKLEEFIDLLPIGILYVNETLKIIGANKTVAGWLYTTKNQIIGSQIQKFFDDFKVVLDKKNQNSWNKVSSGVCTDIFLVCNFFKNNAFIVIKSDFANCLQSIYEQESFLNSAIPAIIVDKDTNIIQKNKTFALKFKIISDKDNLFDHLLDDNKQKLADLIIKSRVKLRAYSELNFKKFDAMIYVSFIKNNNVFLVQFIDISDNKKLEKQLIQSQRMQAIGQLAGGISHDFNNLLTAIIGYSDLLFQKILPTDPTYADVNNIKQNANRAASLVRQLLMFSKQQSLKPSIVSISDAMDELSSLLRRLIGSNIELKIFHGRNLWDIKIDTGQFEQIIINLSINARDAMQKGGTLLIRTGNYSINIPKNIGHDVIPQGDYVLIEIVDTGVGIDEKYHDRVFEPFFSTKDPTKGSGLGLSTVYGIVKQAEGFISFESEKDQGTIFKIFFPKHEGVSKVELLREDDEAKDLSGDETILFVEDEDAVRLFGSRALRDKGYKVIETASGIEAIEMIKDGLNIDLMITDVVMPEVSGTSLCKEIKKILPSLKIILISGYLEETFRKNLDNNDNLFFLQKPFTLKSLVHKVKDVLLYK